MARLLPLLLLALLTGCGYAPPSQEAPRSYQLSGEPQIEPGAQAPLDKVLLVTRPEADPGYQSRAIVYRRGSYDLSRYGRSRWADTPARMLGPAIAKALEQARLFRAVVRPPLTLPADYQLISDLLYLRQDFAGDEATVRLALRVQLLSLAPREVIATRTIVTEAAAPTADAEGAVLGANAALSEALEEVVAFVAEATK